MPKEILYDAQARNSIKSGIDQLARAVKVTLGPKGRNVIIDNENGTPIITKDGVTVAKSIDLENQRENIGAKLVKEVASKTNDLAGDGTTTATVLAQRIIEEGVKMVTAGANPMELKKGIDASVSRVIEHLKKNQKTISDDKEIKNVATISANNDEVIGGIISDAMKKVGKDGVITIEEASSAETYIEVTDGMQYDKGYFSSHFATNEKMEAVFEHPSILVTDMKINSVAEITPLLESVAKAGKAIVIIADDVSPEVLTMLVVNKIRGGLKIVVAKPPAFGERRTETLQDLAILTGGQFISYDTGYQDLSKIENQDFGSAVKVKITKDKTTFIKGAGFKDLVVKRIKQLKEQLKQAVNEFEKQKLKERIANLSGGVSVIYIGALTEVEMKEKKYRYEDALNATKAAIEEGIVPGGGVAYVRAISSLEEIKCRDNKKIANVTSPADYNMGIEIMKRVLEEPLRQIVSNAGLEGSVIIKDVKDSKYYDYGYNANKLQFERLLESGVIDPSKVARVALENAGSIAGTLLTTECLIVNIPKKETAPKIPNLMGM